jgi:hypothetical protein
LPTSTPLQILPYRWILVYANLWGNLGYNGALTAEQFLFYEMRILSKLYAVGEPVEDIIATVKRGNLFQYPAERKVNKLARVCYRRLVALDNEGLVREVSTAPADVAKQISLYAMMRYNSLARDFMVNLICEKYRQRDYAYTKKEINLFFSSFAGAKQQHRRVERTDHNKAETDDDPLPHRNRNA